MFEEPASGAGLIDRLKPEIVGQVGDGVEREGQQVEDGKDGREVLLAVAEIVFEVVALGFQGVEAFVLDLPARPAAGGQFDDGVAADWRPRLSRARALWLSNLACLTVPAIVPPRLGSRPNIDQRSGCPRQSAAVCGRYQYIERSGFYKPPPFAAVYPARPLTAKTGGSSPQGSAMFDFRL